MTEWDLSSREDRGAAEAHRLSDPQIEALFQNILRVRRAQYFTEGCGDRGPWLPSVEYLFTLAYPEKTEGFAQELLEDPESCVPDLYFALSLLPWLSEKTSPRMESLLTGLVQHWDHDLADLALGQLSSLYGLGRHRSLFHEHCKRSCTVAFEGLSYEVNGETIRFLEDLEISERKDPRSDAQRTSSQCHEALERIHILESPDWKRKMEVLLQKGISDSRAEWAECVANRKAPNLVRDYYQRLMAPDHERLTLLLGQTDGESFARRFVQASHLKEMSYDFDSNLYSLADHGGELTPLEKGRLIRLGLLGDAEPRLLEVMKIKIPLPR